MYINSENTHSTPHIKSIITPSSRTSKYIPTTLIARMYTTPLPFHDISHIAPISAHARTPLLFLRPRMYIRETARRRSIFTTRCSVRCCHYARGFKLLVLLEYREYFVARLIESRFFFSFARLFSVPAYTVCVCVCALGKLCVYRRGCGLFTEGQVGSFRPSAVR